MRLVSLKLKNYRQFKEAEIEFPDGVTGIVGLNGTGKSTIIEAIAFTLYGTDAARTRDKFGIRRSGAPAGASVEATLEIEIGGTAYKICRILKGQTQAGAGSIIANGKIIADSVTGLDREIKYLLGMDLSSFKASFLARQKELNALSELKPAQRKDTIIRLLGIDNIDKAIDLVRKEIKEGKLTIEVNRKSLKKDDELIAQNQKILNDIAEQKKKIKQIEFDIAPLIEKQADIAKKFNAVRQLSNEFHKKNEEKVKIISDLDNLKKRAEEIDAEIQEIADLEKEIPALEKNEKEYKELEKQQKDFADAQKQLLHWINFRLEALNKDADDLIEKQKMLKPDEPCPVCLRTIEESDMKTIEQHYEEIKKKIKSEYLELKQQKASLEKDPMNITGLSKAIINKINYDPIEHKKVIKKLESLKEPAAKLPIIQDKVKKRAIVEMNQKRNSLAISKLEKDLDEVSNKIASLNFDEKEHEKLTTVYEELDKALLSRRQEIERAKFDLGHLEGKREEKEKEINENEEMQNKITNKVKFQEKLNRFVLIMIECRDHLISRIQPELADISGRLFTELTNGKYQGVELDEDYEMLIYDGGVKYPLSRFSGGETDLANLCLRLAISQLISSSTGAETGFIILDEIFGSQDPIRKNAILEALSQLSKRFRQILLITHVDDIKDGLEHIIEVSEDDSGISSVKQ